MAEADIIVEVQESPTRRSPSPPITRSPALTPIARSPALTPVSRGLFSPLSLAPRRPSLPPSPTISSALTAPWTFKRVEEMMDAQYNSENSNKSVICDIIAMYLKGQKILYTEAKTVCEQRMNYLMLPAIFITSVCSILSLVLKDYVFGGTVVSSLNGFNAFLLALISYLKLDAKAEAHRTSAYKFDKLQSQLEFMSGKSLFVESSYEDMVKMINDTEANVREIKETNKFILPESIRVRYPIMCNTNVFAEVKKIQNTEIQATNKLKDVLNEKEFLKTSEERRTILEIQERTLISDIIGLKDDYLQIDTMFQKEMEKEYEKIRRGCGCLGWLKT